METLLTPDRQQSNMALLARVRNIDGCIAEMGVFRGGMLAQMAMAAPEKTAYGFDTFQGLPRESWNPEEFHQPGEFAASYDEVSRTMPPNVRLVRGLFPESASGIKDRFCFVHLDFDFEQSTADAIDWLMPRMVRGGIVSFDDYEWQNCPGVKKAIERAGIEVKEAAPYQCYWTAP